jgi:UDP:flavonoid glycosyltransferase YjiC (YdhE family)
VATNGEYKMRVILTPVPVGYGTTSRCLAVASECRRRGNEVLFACAEELHGQIRQHGFAVRTIRDSRVDPKQTTPAAVQYMRRHTRGMLAAQVADLLAIFDEVRPDVVVTSHLNAAQLAASAAGVPSVSVFHPDVMAISSRGLLLAMLSEWLNLTLVGRQVANGRRRWPAPLAELSCIPSIAELIHWPTLLPPGIQRHRAGIVAVGALLNDGLDTLPDRAALRRELGLFEDRPFVYATVGGAVASEAFVETLVEGLERSEVQGLITVGTRLPVSVVARFNRGRVRALSFLTDDLRAMRAADMLLWHGGHETMLKAVACGTPAVGVPFEFDQLSNVRALERTGAGLRLKRDSMSPAGVASAVRRVLDQPSYREAAQRLAKSNRQAGGAQRLVDLIAERFVIPSS